MTLKIFENALKKVFQHCKELNFSDLIRQCRDALGIKQYRAAEFVGISQQRLQNLETGYFRDLPSENELHGLAMLYDINLEILSAKAKQHVYERIIQRKVRVVHDPQEV